MDFTAARNLERNQLMRLSTCEFIRKGENILITGSTGVGKSYIASALGHQGCMSGYKVMYFSSGRLFCKLKMAKAEGTYLREKRCIERQDLLILDDLGLQPMDNQSRLSLLDIIEDRHGHRSMIITSQLPVSGWYEIIGEKTVADAILDRIVHDAHRMELKGECMRRRRSKKIKKENEPINE